MSTGKNEFGLDDLKAYKTLLESTKAIPWRIDWATGKFSYIGPQIEALLGWTPESWVTVEDWAARIHEEDRERVVSFCVSQSKSGVDHEADYRALKKDGEFVWIRDVVHVVRRGDLVEALVGFMFDISERKKSEEELERLRRELERYSYTDGLTSVANRRMFDQVLEREWEIARREGRALSLVMLDIDYFKDYNDAYGHPSGDECLTRVARALSTAAGRPRDVVARFGGEEFVILLPETGVEPAKIVAEKCRQVVLDEKIPHRASKAGDRLSVSLGVGTIVPDEGDSPTDFIARVDSFLYKAKERGRNRVCDGTDG